MAMDETAKVALIRRLSGDIHRRLSQEPAAALNGPTACAQWDVGTVAAHLAGGAVRQRDAMLRGRGGNGGPAAGRGNAPHPRPGAAVQRRQQRPDAPGMGRCPAPQFPGRL